MPRLLNGLTDSFAFEKLTVSSTVKTLTASVYHQKSSTNAPNKIARFATISVETDSIRYRLDGTDPDSTTGHLLQVGDVLELDSANDVAKFKAIRVSGDATIQVSYA
jgi:hypothetical protein